MFLGHRPSLTRAAGRWWVRVSCRSLNRKYRILLKTAGFPIFRCFQLVSNYYQGGSSFPMFLGHRTLTQAVVMGRPRPPPPRPRNIGTGRPLVIIGKPSANIGKSEKPCVFRRILHFRLRLRQLTPTHHLPAALVSEGRWPRDIGKLEPPW